MRILLRRRRFARGGRRLERRFTLYGIAHSPATSAFQTGASGLWKLLVYHMTVATPDRLRDRGSSVHIGS